MRAYGNRERGQRQGRQPGKRGAAPRKHNHTKHTLSHTSETQGAASLTALSLTLTVNRKGEAPPKPLVLKSRPRAKHERKSKAGTSSRAQSQERTRHFEKMSCLLLHSTTERTQEKQDPTKRDEREIATQAKTQSVRKMNCEMFEVPKAPASTKPR